MKAKQFFLSISFLYVSCALPQSPFIVTPASAETQHAPSRNQTKEAIGGRLHELVTLSARMQSRVGKMMQFAALQTTIAEQAEALVEDEKPFSSASTEKLQAAEKKMGHQVAELEQLLDSLDALAQRVQKTVRLE